MGAQQSSDMLGAVDAAEGEVAEQQVRGHVSRLACGSWLENGLVVVCGKQRRTATCLCTKGYLNITAAGCHPQGHQTVSVRGSWPYGQVGAGHVKCPAPVLRWAAGHTISQARLVPGGKLCESKERHAHGAWMPHAAAPISMHAFLQIFFLNL